MVFIGVFVLVLLSFTIGFSVAFGTTSTFYNNMGDAFMSTVMMVGKSRLYVITIRLGETFPLIMMWSLQAQF